MGVQKLREALNLVPHPEGGFYAETFRDDSVKLETSSLPSHFKVGRSVSTAIYFLLPTGSKSRMHIIPSAEVWHFYSGEPLTEEFFQDRVANIKEQNVAHISYKCLELKGTQVGVLNLSLCHRYYPIGALKHSFSHPVKVLEVDQSGNVKHTILGPDIEAGQVPQYVVPPRVWFGAYPTKDYKVDVDGGTVETLAARDPEQNYSLVGCTVAPGFQFEDFEMAKRSNLISLYPQAKSAIELLTDPEE